MNEKRQRVIGTTEEAIAKAERELDFRFPPSFRSWLLMNNGLDADGVNIFPVYDERDARKTWDSIVRNYRANWMAWLETFADEEINAGHLLPFGEFGTGDYYCFDYSRVRADKETPVVRWSHETGAAEDRAETFTEFLERLRQGEYEND